MNLTSFKVETWDKKIPSASLNPTRKGWIRVQHVGADYRQIFVQVQ
ncbi:hypothetical protein CSE899_04363 [Cronobacter sakazakii E899]|nr:hypothetical protein CSE899_04363 [Cronobacter sakazakii E899]